MDWWQGNQLVRGRGELANGDGDAKSATTALSARCPGSTVEVVDVGPLCLEEDRSVRITSSPPPNDAVD